MSYTEEELFKIKILADDYRLSENKVKKLLTLGYSLGTIDELLEYETYEELRDKKGG